MTDDPTAGGRHAEAVGSVDAEHRLAVYGTLAPGRSNEAELADIEGTWTRGTVRGHLFAQGWGAASGYPGILLDDDGPEVEVHVLSSPELSRHWHRLDAFEGPGYRRATAEVTVAGEVVAAQVYTLVEEA